MKIQHVSYLIICSDFSACSISFPALLNVSELSHFVFYVGNGRLLRIYDKLPHNTVKNVDILDSRKHLKVRNVQGVI